MSGQISLVLRTDVFFGTVSPIEWPIEAQCKLTKVLGGLIKGSQHRAPQPTVDTVGAMIFRTVLSDDNNQSKSYAGLGRLELAGAWFDGYSNRCRMLLPYCSITGIINRFPN